MSPNIRFNGEKRPNYNMLAGRNFSKKFPISIQFFTRKEKTIAKNLLSLSKSQYRITRKNILFTRIIDRRRNK
jgi:hypothetical protein